ncbi:pyruvate formate lyase 1-activating protein [Suttonella ornithocola]|uniref:Pyruvate formate-lyase-activating enzyme n=1 Tax=Suttonella ornithocola TaxID=279832 RepID=A0A380MUZ7_9GAMM|nr:pyruvate formate lyase 1-activating protein [Suttonella ornithocola]SUO96395.1 Pyruvate formate-lyase 1-activating enzyme [Suttonella ornithocola]
MNRYGIIHSIETCGAVDGPGLRYVLFFQGCLMRCLYCHNRDTWDLHSPTEKQVSVEEIMKQVRQYRHYLRASGGGVTASGGEALLQPEFVRDWFVACHQEKIHTCLDTNGYARHYDQTLEVLLDNTDLVMLDLKQLDNEKHERLVGVPNTRTLIFAKHLQARKQAVRVRYVVVPGYTDDDESAHLLGQFIAPMDNIKEVELLPYHSLGTHKWALCGDTYRLENVNPPSDEIMEKIGDIIKSYGKSIL